MVEVADFSKNTHVMAPLGTVFYRSIVVDPPANHSQPARTVCVEFTPPVPDGQNPGHFYNFLTCDIDKLKIGWPDSGE